MAQRNSSREARLASLRLRASNVILALAFVLTGCATTHVMMPTPVLYTGPNAKPLFTDSSVDNRPPSLDLLFVTDRASEQQADGLRYTAARSRSVAFGSATVEFGDGVTWDTLLHESTATQHGSGLRLKLGAKIFKVFSDPDLPFGESAASDALIPPAPGLRVTVTMFTPEQIEAIGKLRVVDIVQVRGTTDFFGHGYFVTNPQVSADIIAMLRYDLPPDEPGRPLEHVAGSFWRVPAQ